MSELCVIRVAARLTDEQIESIAESLEHDAENLYGDNTRSFMDDENNAASVLRDYVRLRKLNDELSNCVRDAISFNCALCKSRHTVACDMDGFCSERKWKKILAEAEKGEMK